MPTAQASRDDHSVFVCHKCLDEKKKSEIFMNDRKYVCGDCR